MPRTRCTDAGAMLAHWQWHTHVARARCGAGVASGMRATRRTRRWPPRQHPGTNPGEWFIRGLAPLYFRDRSYLAESTRLHQNPEVKLLRVSLVVTSGTSCESLIMIAFFLFFLHAHTHVQV